MYSKSQLKRIAVMKPDALVYEVWALQENLRAAESALRFAVTAKTRLKASKNAAELVLETARKCEAVLNGIEKTKANKKSEDPVQPGGDVDVPSGSDS